MNKLMLGCGVVILASVANPAMSLPGEAPEADPDYNFSVYDLDQNGTISTHEAIQDRYLQSVFRLMDTNRDEQLTREEFDEFQESREKKRS